MLLGKFQALLVDVGHGRILLFGLQAAPVAWVADGVHMDLKE
jgi:hypothetical protein